MDDTTLTEVYNDFATANDCYLDGILCDPDLRKSFLDELRGGVGGFSEKEMLGRLVHLRKQGRLARQKPR